MFFGNRFPLKQTSTSNVKKRMSIIESDGWVHYRILKQHVLYFIHTFHINFKLMYRNVAYNDRKCWNFSLWIETFIILALLNGLVFIILTEQLHCIIIIKTIIKLTFVTQMHTKNKLFSTVYWEIIYYYGAIYGAVGCRFIENKNHHELNKIEVSLQCLYQFKRLRPLQVQ